MLVLFGCVNNASLVVVVVDSRKYDFIFTKCPMWISQEI